jgi:putative membrane protein
MCLFEHLRQRSIGVGLTLAACVATVWLWLSGDLGLYVHPRYFVFTVIAAALGLVIVVASFVVRVPPDDAAPATRARRTWRGVLSIAVVTACIFGVVALIVLPPATLTSATADQRSVNSGTVVGAGAPQATGDTADYGVKEWATALRQSTDLQGIAGSPAELTGFISADPDDPENVFFVTRFFVTCCAADAQPVGVPVYQPDWQQSLALDDWVEVTGAFDLNPSVKSRQPMVLMPNQVTSVDEPSDPYVY